MGREPVALEALGTLAERVRPVTLARDRQLPVLPELMPLLPGGALQRGTTVAVDAGRGVTGATTLALAVAAGASQAGSWVAMVGMGAVGLVAADRLGVSFERLALVSSPSPSSPSPSPSPSSSSSSRGGSSSRGAWASTMAALVDGFDVVLVAAVGPGARLRSGDARRLVARVRERGAVLVAVGGELPGQRSTVHLTVTSAAWTGLEDGAGHLSGRRATVAASGRGEAARPRRASLWLPGEDGRIAVVEPEATPIPLHDPGLSAVGPAAAAQRAAATSRHPAGAHRAVPVALREARPRRRRVGHPLSPRQARPDQPGRVAEGAAS
jgi:hypothetical protein